MELPIIATENGDVTFFASLGEAAAYMEPIDVRNGECQVFDATGKLLEPIATAPIVTIIESEKPSESAQLTEILRSFFVASGVDASWVKSASLAELVSLGAKDYITQ